MNNYDFGGAADFGHSQIATVDTAKYVAATVVRGMQLLEERERWRSRIEALHASYAKYGATEENALQDRRLRTDLARFAIEKLSEKGDTQAIVEVFKDYNSTGYDFLGKVIEFIAVNLQIGEETS